MRALAPTPSSVIDPVTRLPRHGSYVGTLDTVDYSPLELALWQRALRTKRWLYTGLATDELFVAVAVVHMGYAANVFAYVYDASVGRNVATASLMGPSIAARVAAGPGRGRLASIGLPGAKVDVRRDAHDVIALDASFRDLEVHARFDAASAPPGIVAIAPIPGGLVNTTQKRALMPVTGEVVIRGRSRSLDGGFGGYDATHGLLARHTSWRWAFLLGHARDGAPVALNLVDGFVGERECAVWHGREIHGVGEGRVALDHGALLRPWHVTTADHTVDLRFAPGDLHTEKRNLGIVDSNFVQAVGRYEGVITLPGHAPIELVSALGVAEDNSIDW